MQQINHQSFFRCYPYLTIEQWIPMSSQCFLRWAPKHDIQGKVGHRVQFAHIGQGTTWFQSVIAKKLLSIDLPGQNKQNLKKALIGLRKILIATTRPLRAFRGPLKALGPQRAQRGLKKTWKAPRKALKNPKRSLKCLEQVLKAIEETLQGLIRGPQNSPQGH